MSDERPGDDEPEAGRQSAGLDGDEDTPRYGRVVHSANAAFSDLSGETLASEPELVCVILKDGTRRRLRISAAEHLRLASAGEGDSRTRRALTGGATAVPKLALLMLTAFVSAYVANLYSDNEQSVRIKSALVSAINSSSVRVYDDALDVVRSAGKHRSERALGEQRNRVLARWTEASQDADGSVFLHFRRTHARRSWQRFEEAMYTFVALAHLYPYEQPKAHTKPLRRYLRGSTYSRPPRTRPWTILECQAPDCRTTEEWFDSYAWLGERLLARRQGIMESFLHAKTENLG